MAGEILLQRKLRAWQWGRYLELAEVEANVLMKWWMSGRAAPPPIVRQRGVLQRWRRGDHDLLAPLHETRPNQVRKMHECTWIEWRWSGGDGVVVSDRNTRGTPAAVASSGG